MQDTGYKMQVISTISRSARGCQLIVIPPKGGTTDDCIKGY